MASENAATSEQVETTVEELRQAAEQANNAAQELAKSADQVEGLISPLETLTQAAHVADWVYLGAIFVLAVFVGYYVVWSVTPALHTPLMSVTNAVSSVVIVGALIAVGADVAQSPSGGLSRFFGVLGVALASVNIFGGFLVTQRMLAMYKKKGA
ncbi:NAD(P) transhydrogenase subunit alpha part 2 [Parvularcula bermudensis HTCC2503]|uniref:proton-translocating NAD(P)(+) transhydrogenase n=1 Tax=Parvularcula bermudensis (strain ATCC BAA-594 / HTCC2503 / KCTC 12087) TaxID=314260 RepID=E0THC5_PARBH|nr:NAD(P) transhydrogenase subunit alpha [Parvularcula bermudensis]ADM10215.1 NAD(P) transhydrogenase subunit alpha part 2 [Parvularcula bermudensis HTCC2503]